MEKKQGMSRKTLLLLAGALLLLAAAFALVYLLAALAPAAGEKTVTVAIVHGDGTQKTLTLQTDAQYLRGALEEQEGLLAGEEGPYGLFVTAVDGETADADKQQWWCFTKGGEPLNTGVDETPIAHGDAFEITLTTGW